MRERKEIEKDLSIAIDEKSSIWNGGGTSPQMGSAITQLFMLETLLDIRELLQKEK